MGRNLYFNNFGSDSEQSLYESLIIESIGVYGHDVYFCPRTVNKKDDIYGEDQLSTYESALDTEVYIKSWDSYQGDGTFLSKFNIEVRDQIVFSMARKTFAEDIGIRTLAERPKEGDLIYSEMMKRMFIIKYVENTPVFYQLGALQTWDLTCEVFEYSNERFSTGNAEIDAIQTTYSFAGSGTTQISNTAFESSLFDVLADNKEIVEEKPTLLDWTEVDPFSQGSIGS